MMYFFLAGEIVVSQLEVERHAAERTQKRHPLARVPLDSKSSSVLVGSR